MMRRLLISLAFILWVGLALAQTTGDRIDLYFGDWHGAAARTTRGALEERDILTKGDPQNPTRKGAVLRFVNSFTYATLPPRASSKAIRLDGQQEVYFIESGRGTATAAGQTTDLYRNIALLVPAGLEFSLTNTGAEPLAMYVINEPVPSSFRPNSTILVKDENKVPISSSDGHWAHIVKPLFATADGLGTLESVLTVTIDPLTLGKPHLVDHDDIEEVWTALNGTSLAFVGNRLLWQSPGMAFYHIPDNKTPHTNINQNEDTQVRFLYFARYHPHEPRP